jgi:hypothetical protein
MNGNPALKMDVVGFPGFETALATQNILQVALLPLLSRETSLKVQPKN